MHDTPDKTKLIGNIAAVLADFVSGRLCVPPNEIMHIGRLRKHIRRISQLRNLGDNGTAKLKDVLVPKQEDVDAALLQLLVEERIVVRLPAELSHIEIGWNTEPPAQIG